MASSSDKSLLDRLNALKATNVTLDQSENALNIPTTGISQGTEGPSREDALSARLKLLRSQSSHTSDQGQGASSPQSQKPAEVTSKAGPSQKSNPVTTSVEDWEKEYDHSILEDDATLFDYGASLEEDDLEAIARGGGQEEDEDEKVSKLLASIGKDIPKDDWRETRDADGDSDDSDGEVMSREVDRVLSQARDEAELAAQDAEYEVEEPPPDEGTNALRRGDLERTQSKDQSNPTEATKPQVDDDAFTLPSAPTTLPSPPSEPNPDASTNPTPSFETSIAARMAALKLPSANAPSANDPFGLPSAPTFAPEDRRAGTLVAKKSAYTDEDEKTWCVICLEDATVRCEGCDDDVYCARCWKEGHVGPDAGYDVRGHRWVTFRR